MVQLSERIEFIVVGLKIAHMSLGVCGCVCPCACPWACVAVGTYVCRRAWLCAGMFVGAHDWVQAWLWVLMTVCRCACGYTRAWLIKQMAKQTYVNPVPQNWGLWALRRDPVIFLCSFPQGIFFLFV